MTNSGEEPKPKKPRRLRRLVRIAVLVFVVLLGLVYFVYILPFWGIPFNQSRHGRVPITPPWALECWLWEDDFNTEAYVKELLEGYRKWDLPVRTVLIDSPWSMRYNDFKVDETRYPEPDKFFRDLKADGYRVVLWMTCMVNSRNKDTPITDAHEFYEEARSKDYLAGSGYQLGWWKGRGGFIDYTDPQAMTWWQGLQQRVLDWGVDGWKLDGCDTFFSGRVWKVPVPFNRAHSGWLTTRQYMDHYARDEYQHGLAHNPQFAILVRAMDRPWSHPEGFSPLDAATVTWMGDNRHTWNYKDRGIEEAITDILLSAKLGYCVTGSDVAGYHGRSNPDDMGPATAGLLAAWKSSAPAQPLVVGDFGGSGTDEIAPNIYIRWAELSAFCGLFLNGGHGERRLWKRTRPELEIIRKFSWLHTELAPYMFSHVVECHNGAPPLIRPAAKGKFHYLFGDDFLVAPIHQDSLSRTVSLPSGTWRYLFSDREPIAGPKEITRDFPLDEYPVFVREGAVVPLNVSRPYTGLGDPDSAWFRTWLIYPGASSKFTLWHPESFPKLEQTTVTVDSGEALRIEFAGKREPHLLRIFATLKPTRITLDGSALAEGEAWSFDRAASRLIIRTKEYDKGSYVISWR
jgi:alpha-D-xyloside xylohydrolase